MFASSSTATSQYYQAYDRLRGKNYVCYSRDEYLYIQRKFDEEYRHYTQAIYQPQAYMSGSGVQQATTYYNNINYEEKKKKDDKLKSLISYYYNRK